jgi:hypothetical protein
MKGGLRKLQRDVGFSKFLLSLLLPLCLWGLISSLLLYLIEIRSLFIAGGEWRLRQALLAFAVGIILIQRISRMLGRNTARIYTVALGVAITLFTGYMAHAYRIPTHPLIVFLVNEILVVILWFVVHMITASCWIDDPVKQMTAMDIGIFARIRIRKELEKEKPTKEELERRWVKALPRQHPGRMILYFSLLAVPAFGVGIYLFNTADPGVRFRVGIYIFVYLWCAFALLFLSSLSQLASYLEKRDVPLPEAVGVPWLSIGFFVVTSVLIGSVFLPQPPSLQGLYVRDRIMANYKGWTSKHGVKENLGTGGKSGAEQSGDMKSAPLDRDKVSDILDKRYDKVDQLKDPYLSDIHRNTGIEPEYRNVLKASAATSETFGKIFDMIIKLFFVLLILCGLVVLYIVGVSLTTGLSQSYSSWRNQRAKEKIKPPKKKRKKKPTGEGLILERFRRFADPFARGAGAREGNALVRYLWEAFLAFCEDYGTPCSADVTPFEFVGRKPGALEGFEDHARYIADLFTFSEYSGETVSTSENPRLEKFWASLQKHAQWMAG